MRALSVAVCVCVRVCVCCHCARSSSGPVVEAAETASQSDTDKPRRTFYSPLMANRVTRASALALHGPTALDVVNNCRVIILYLSLSSLKREARRKRERERAAPIPFITWTCFGTWCSNLQSYIVYATYFICHSPFKCTQILSFISKLISA